MNSDLARREKRAGSLALLFTSLIPLAVATNLAAQAAAPTNTGVKPVLDEPTIELTPFEVRVDRDIGYLGLDAASGSRLNSNVKDTPAALSIFTAEFMQDIGATSVDDLAKYALNTDFDVGFVSESYHGHHLARPADRRRFGVGSHGKFLQLQLRDRRLQHRARRIFPRTQRHPLRHRPGRWQLQHAVASR
jgi:hypothetical protein